MAFSDTKLILELIFKENIPLNGWILAPRTTLDPQAIPVPKYITQHIQQFKNGAVIKPITTWVRVEAYYSEQNKIGTLQSRLLQDKKSHEQKVFENIESSQLIKEALTWCEQYSKDPPYSWTDYYIWPTREQAINSINPAFNT
jgi:hypothetical protein